MDTIENNIFNELDTVTAHNPELSNEDFKKEDTYFDTLVLSGGSTKGIMILGALQYAHDNFLLKINTYIGTSAGAMIGYLLAIGYTPVEIMTYICKNQLLEKMQHFNIVAMINGSGAISYNNIYEHFEKMTIDKIGFLPTFKDLYIKFNKKLICATYNITENITEYISHETYPELPCLIGLKMSSNLPLIFENYKYGNSFYIDGGISDNFPIDIADKIGNKILGLLICSHQENFNNEPDAGFLEFIYKLMFIPISQIIEYKIKNASEKCQVIKLNCSKLKFFNFNINSKTKLDLFSQGYEQMKSNFE